MLIIRDEQMTTLGDDTRRAFVDRVAAYCSERHPAVAASLGAGEVQARVAAAVDLMEERGIEAGEDIVRYAELAILFGADFELTEEWAGQLLLDASGERMSDVISKLHLAGLDMPRGNGAQPRDGGKRALCQ